MIIKYVCLGFVSLLNIVVSLTCTVTHYSTTFGPLRGKPPIAGRLGQYVVSDSHSLPDEIRTVSHFQTPHTLTFRRRKDREINHSAKPYWFLGNLWGKPR